MTSAPTKTHRLIKLTLVPEALARIGYKAPEYSAVHYHITHGNIPFVEVNGKSLVDRDDLEDIAERMRLTRRKGPDLISAAELSTFLSLFGSGGDADRFFEHALIDPRHPLCLPYAKVNGKVMFDCDCTLTVHAYLRVAEPTGCWNALDDRLGKKAAEAKAEAMEAIDLLREQSLRFLQRAGHEVLPAVSVAADTSGQEAAA